MQLEDQLTYCKVCTNRLFEAERGLLCSLTGEKPKFFPTCSEFLEDKDERLELETNLRYGISGIEDDRGSTKVTYSYPSTDRSISQVAKRMPEQFELRNSIQTGIIMMLIFPLMIILGLWFNNWTLTNFELQASYKLGLLVSFGFLAYGTYLIRDRSIKGVIGKKGFKLPSSGVIKWDIVLSVHLKKIIHHASSETSFSSSYLSVKLMGRGTALDIPLTSSLNVSNNKLHTIIEAYRKNWKETKSTGP